MDSCGHVHEMKEGIFDQSEGESSHVELRPASLESFVCTGSLQGFLGFWRFQGFSMFQVACGLCV